MNYTISRQTKGPVASVLRQHYERLLFPYDVLMSGATIGADGLVIKAKPTSSPAAAAVHEQQNTSQSSDLKQECKREPASDSEGNQQGTPEQLPTPPSEPLSEGVVPTRARSRRRAGCQEENENEPDRKVLRSSPRKNPGTIAARRMQAAAPATIGRTRRSVGLTAHPPAAVSRSSNNCKALATIMNLRSSKELKKLQVHGAGPKAPGIEIMTTSPTVVPLLSTPSSSTSSSTFDRRAYNRNRRLTFSSYSSLAASYSSFLRPSSHSSSSDSKVSSPASKKVRFICLQLIPL